MTEIPWIVTFPSTHLALRAERAAKQADIAVRMIPVPRRLSADCNMGMRLSAGDRDKLEELLKSAGVECTFVRWHD